MAISHITGVVGSNDTGIFFGADGEPLELVLRTSDFFEVAPGEQRTITSLSLGATNAGFLNDNGQIAFGTGFTDGSRDIFVASMDTGGDDQMASVPLPGSLGLIARGDPGRRDVRFRCVRADGQALVDLTGVAAIVPDRIRGVMTFTVQTRDGRFSADLSGRDHRLRAPRARQPE